MIKIDDIRKTITGKSKYARKVKDREFRYRVLNTPLFGDITIDETESEFDFWKKIYNKAYIEGLEDGKNLRSEQIRNLIFPNIKDIG